MNDARLGAFAAPHFAGYQPHATGAAVARPAVVGHSDAVAQSSVEQQFTATRLKAASIYGDLAAWHFLIHGCFRTKKPKQCGLAMTFRRKEQGKRRRNGAPNTPHYSCFYE